MRSYISVFVRELGKIIFFHGIRNSICLCFFAMAFIGISFSELYAQSEIDNKVSRVKLTVIGQMPIEKNTGIPFAGIWVKVRLANLSDGPVLYQSIFIEDPTKLLEDDSPILNYYKRKFESTEWIPLIRPINFEKDNEIPLLGQTYIEIGKGKSIEIDFPSSYEINVEKRLSVLIKTSVESKPIEIFSNPYIPIRNVRLDD